MPNSLLEQVGDAASAAAQSASLVSQAPSTPQAASRLEPTDPQFGSAAGSGMARGEAGFERGEVGERSLIQAAQAERGSGDNGIDRLGQLGAYYDGDRPEPSSTSSRRPPPLPTAASQECSRAHRLEVALSLKLSHPVSISISITPAPTWP